MVPTVLVATWHDGVFAVSEKDREHELAGRAVRGLTTDGAGGALAIVDGCALQRRSASGAWALVTTADCQLSCCVASGDTVYLGSEDARVFRLDADQRLTELRGFDSVEGRETWAAGQMLVNGKLLGPPLGVRSIAATAHGVLLANVHVGGIPRSFDAGESWHPTIEVESDVHEVRAHPSRASIVAAAAAAGLCTSRDGGASWSVQHDGLHARYCSAVAFVGDSVLVTASEHHFSAQGKLYRRLIDGGGRLSAVRGGLPEWTDGIVDTQCLAVAGSAIALADQGGNLYVSADTGESWSRWAQRLPPPSSVLIA